MPALGNSAASDSTTPLPMAVPRCIWKRSMAASTSSRLSVGGCTSAAVPAKLTTPTRTLRGSAATKARAAFCEATRRLGSTSVARMLPDTSMARMTVRCTEGRVSTAVGRAAASSSAASASNSSKGGTWRRQPLRRPIASFTSAICAKGRLTRWRRRSSHT